MKASEKDILTAFLGKTLNMPTEETAKLFIQNGEEFDLTPTSIDVLLAANATKIQALKEEGETKFLNGQKKATKEFGSNRDKEIKDKYGIESDAIGLDLIDEVITAKTVAPNGLDDDKVKVHPVYIAREKELLKQLQETKDSAEAKLTKREREIIEEKTFSEVLTEADVYLDNFKPILPKDAKVAKNQKKLLVDELRTYNFQKNGTQTIPMKGEKRVEDEHGNPVSLENLVKNIASNYWEFEQGTPRSGSGSTTQTTTTTGAAAAENVWVGKVPTNDEEFSREFAKLGGSENAPKRIALLAAYDALKQKV